MFCRRLCILKGIYPQEPKHKHKVNKGSSTYKTYYFRKDIQWLAHEPLLKKGLEFKIFLKRLKKALDKDDKVKMANIEEHRPRYTLDHVVRERYPTFVDALRDIDDALTMVFLYSSMASKKVKVDSRRVTAMVFLIFHTYVYVSTFCSENLQPRCDQSSLLILFVGHP